MVLTGCGCLIVENGELVGSERFSDGRGDFLPEAVACGEGVLVSPGFSGFPAGPPDSGFPSLLGRGGGP